MGEEHGGGGKGISCYIGTETEQCVQYSLTNYFSFSFGGLWHTVRINYLD